MKKREPLLADLMLHPSRDMMWGKQFEMTSRDHLLQAKRFVLDADATRYIAEMIRDVPRIIADAQDFAIPPFHTMWIEFPFDVMWHTINPNPDPSQVGGPTDKRIGFLIVGNQVRVAVQAQDNVMELPAWCPIEYMLNYPMSIEEERAFCTRYGLSRLTLDHLYWGSSLFKFMDKNVDLRWNEDHVPAWPDEIEPDANAATTYRMMQKDMAVSLEDTGDGGSAIRTNIEHMNERDAADARTSLRALRASHGVRVIEPPVQEFGEIDPKAFFHTAVSQSAGDLRNLIAILLFLNRTPDLQTQRFIAPQQQMIRNKVRPLLSHNVITIKLNPINRFKKMVAGEGVWKRLHDVRGHFCHNERARTAPCMHPEWEETRPLYWVCPHCKGAKWWRHEHRRGHEEKGIVTSEYKVVK